MWRGRRATRTPEGLLAVAMLLACASWVDTERARSAGPHSYAARLGRSPLASRGKLGYNPAMNLLRATYSFWYFTTGSRWQPMGRV
jgi:hypothetical protein